jgi:hypothetical protein
LRLQGQRKKNDGLRKLIQKREDEIKVLNVIKEESIQIKRKIKVFDDKDAKLNEYQNHMVKEMAKEKQ